MTADTTLHSDTCQYPIYSIGSHVYDLTGDEVTTCPGCHQPVTVYRGAIVVDELQPVRETDDRQP